MQPKKPWEVALRDSQGKEKPGTEGFDHRAVRLRARRGELAEAIFARVSGDAFPSAGDGDAEYLAGLRAAVAATLALVVPRVVCVR
jgi:hypothetical protein